ncbi:hypothetical protein EVAR_17653_1 [Eumeta japonica]|uniref:Uncharacterized protein n=1 Tax=Eumeta variegata TaxID=151549 RepID=A0A4C1USW5_EUMVA|nr:hypothetical protein EVAR_17653_1 [Eumeta japonica]
MSVHGFIQYSFALRYRCRPPCALWRVNRTHTHTHILRTDTYRQSTVLRDTLEHVYRDERSLVVITADPVTALEDGQLTLILNDDSIIIKNAEISSNRNHVQPSRVPIPYKPRLNNLSTDKALICPPALGIPKAEKAVKSSDILNENGITDPARLDEGDNLARRADDAPRVLCNPL